MEEESEPAAGASETRELDAYRSAALHLMRRANVAQYFDRDADPGALAQAEGFATGFYEAYRAFMLVLQAELGVRDDINPADSPLDYLVLDQMRGGPANFDLEDTRRFLARTEEEARQRIETAPASDSAGPEPDPGSPSE